MAGTPQPSDAPASPARAPRTFLWCLFFAVLFVAVIATMDWVMGRFFHNFFSIFSTLSFPGMAAVAGFCLLTGTNFLGARPWVIEVFALALDVLFYAVFFYAVVGAIRILRKFRS